jgi:N-acetylglucosamine-6-phosphate deacetylase
MLSAVKNAVNLLECSLEQALMMATATPAQFLGMGHQKGKIDIGHDADWILLDENINIASMFIGGKRVEEYTANN